MTTECKAPGWIVFSCDNCLGSCQNEMVVKDTWEFVVPFLTFFGNLEVFPNKIVFNKKDESKQSRTNIFI